MRDRYVVFENEARVPVSQLTDEHIAETLDMLEKLEPRDGTDATHAAMRERLLIEQLIRRRNL